MTLHQLEYFVSLAKTLHYTKTSEQLHISQPSLSYEIRELERSLGTELFDRSRRKISLTEQGKAFLPYAEKALSTLGKGTELLSRMEKKSGGEIRLGYFHSVATPLIPDLVDGFFENYGKGTRFRFSECSSKELESLLRKGELDICFTPEKLENADSVLFVRQPLYCCVNGKHSLAQRTSLDFSEIVSEPQILLEQGNNLRSLLDACFAECDAVPNAVFEVKECNAAVQYVAMDFGVSVLPPVPAMESSKIRSIPLTLSGRPLERSVYLSCTALSELSEPARLFRSFVLSGRIARS